MKSKNGFSLTELLVGILVASILILTIGVLSSIASSSYKKIYSKQAVYNDISYGFKLMENKVRASSAISVTAASGSWVSSRVSVSAGSFGIYRDTTHTPATREFSYDTGTRETILSIPDPDNSSAVLDLTATLSTNAATVTITGQKDNIPFNIQTTITKRNS